MTELNCTSNTVDTPHVKKFFTLESSYLGLMDYNKAVTVQLSLTDLAKCKNQISILGLQHPKVITLGRRADQKTEVNLNKNNGNIPIVRSSRGGLATIHSEGQLVIYPIVNLKYFNLGIRDYVCLLLLTTQDLLKMYDISSKIDINGAGLFTEMGKISFCGIEVHEGITRHGISLNVRNDLSLFDLIRSCGVQDLKLDAIKNYQVYDTLEEVFQKWIFCFRKNLLPIC